MGQGWQRGRAAVRMAMLATLPSLDPVPVDVDSLRREMEAWDVEGALPNIRGTVASIRVIGHQLRTYLLGLMSAHEGDFETALAHADQTPRLRRWRAG